MIDTGCAVVPDNPHDPVVAAWARPIRPAIAALELGLGDRLAFRLLVDELTDHEAETALTRAVAVHSRRRLKTPRSKR